MCHPVTAADVMTDNKGAKEGGGEDEDDVEWIAPEGGWGYMVAVGFSLLFIIVAGPISNFGMIFNDFFDRVGYGTSGLTLVNGVYNAVVSFTGFFTTFALKRYSLRQVGFFGSFMFVAGAIMMIFTMSVPYLVFAVGVLQGVGFGVMMPIVLTSFNNYFVKRRVAFMGITSVFVSAGLMAFPTAIKYLMENYGFRGTLTVLSAVSFHVVLSMAVMQPIEWHLVPRPKSPDQKISVKETASGINGINGAKSELSQLTIIATTNNNNNNNNNNEKGLDAMTLITIVERDMADLNGDALASESKEPLLMTPILKMATVTERRRSSVAYSDAFGSHRSIFLEHRIDTKMVKASSLASLGNWTSAVLATEAVSTKSGTWQTFVDSFDLNMLRDPIYSNICFGVSFAFFSEITFFILEPMLLYHYGFTQAEVAMCITAGAASDLIFRVFLAAYTFRFAVNSRYIFFTGTCCIMVLRIAFMQYRDFSRVLALTACLGVFRSWIHVFLPLVFAESCTNAKFPTAYGLFMMISGVITLTMSVVVGFIRDYTDNYTYAFHFLTVCCLLLIVPWSAEFYYVHKNKTTKSVVDR